MPTTIEAGKELANPGKPLVLCQIVATDGDTVYLTTSPALGGATQTYGGNTYLARIQNQVIDAIQAQSPQGYDVPGSVQLVIADGDHSLWTNHAKAHGWRGATLSILFVLWDVVVGTYSTNSYQWQFILGTPGVDAAGVITVEAVSRSSMTRLKVPNVPRQNRCPWVFPATGGERAEGLLNPTSIYYQCGYSPDQTGGCGSLNAGSPFTTCDYTKQSCQARGMFSVDSSARATARFGGDTWLPAAKYEGKKYTSGAKVEGFNVLNNAPGQFYPLLYGTQWVECIVLEPAADPNSLRAECIVCVACDGPVTVQRVLVNGVEVPYNNPGDNLFTWRYVNQGGRTGTINTDKLFDGNGDPHGSLCCIEVVVPQELAAGGSIPHVQALATAAPTLKAYPLATATASGGNITFTFAAGVPDVDIGNGTVVVSGVTGFPAANGTFQIATGATYGPPGVIVTTGVTATGSGTGGGVFYYRQTTNPVWHLMDLLTWGPFKISDFDAASWYGAAAVCDAPVTYTDLTQSTATHARYRSSFVLTGNSRQALASAVLGLRNNAGLILSLNQNTGLLQCAVEQTLADQQPAPITGSNYNTAVTSITAGGGTANGYLAYLFDGAGSIEKGTLKLTGRSINDTPNRVSLQFQDEDNKYQSDSLSQVDPLGYISAGNQEIDVPLQVLGICNFDQATRRANVELAKALYGNSRADEGGTEYFEFVTSAKGAHLAGKVGSICGLHYEQLGL